MTETFAELQDRVGSNFGIAVLPLSGAAITPTLLGNWTTGPAWSTIKVPIAQAALNSGTANSTWVNQAITTSDNSAAANLWSSLGAPSVAGTQVQNVLRGAGDSSTVVQTQAVNPPYSAYGQTQWSLSDQVRFLSQYSKDPRSAQVLGLMGNITPDQRWGLGDIPGAQFKGGWGPGDDEYLLRQMGIIDTPQGPVAVAMAVESPGTGDDAFASGQTQADSIAQWIKDHAGALAYGNGNGTDSDTASDGATGQTGDPTLKVNKDDAHSTYSAAQGSLAEQSGAIPGPQSEGLDDQQIADALTARVQRAKGHLTDAQDSLQQGQSAATAIEDAANQGAAAVDQTPVPVAFPATSPAATPTALTATPPSNPLAANPFATPSPAPGIPQFAMPTLPTFTAPSTGTAAPATIRPAALTTPRQPHNGMPWVKDPGKLTLDSTPEQVFAAVLAEAARRGYSLDKALACGSTMLQESGGNPRAVSPNGAWVGPYQQDNGYPGRNDPNTNISEFFNRLDAKGGRTSPDIWKTIFWLQQRPAETSAEIAYQNGRQAYLTEIQSQHGRAVAMYDKLQTQIAAEIAM